MRSYLDTPPPAYYPTPTAPIANTTKQIPNELKKELDANCEYIQQELKKYGFNEGHESQIAVFLDVSASMENPNGFYFGQGYTEEDRLKNGMIQKALVKALSLAVELSPDHLITIFPFGKIAYQPVIITEEEIEIAAIKVFNSINREFSLSTDYYLPLEFVRRYYFNQSGPTVTDRTYERAPVFAIWLTDGEANAHMTDALNEFRSSSYNAIFHKFIALRGRNSNLDFMQLKKICALEANLPNRDLVILNSPDELTIPLFFKNYRLWLEEAHDHGILVNDPCIDMNITNPDILNQQEVSALMRLEGAHAHDHKDGASALPLPLPRYAASGHILMGANRAQSPAPTSTVRDVEDNRCSLCTIS